MKLKLTMLSLMGAMTLTAGAQDGGSCACKTAYEKSTSHNWFITLQGGATMMFNGHNDNAKFADRIRIAPSIALGKWHTPYYATRLKVVGGEAVSYDGFNAEWKNTNMFVGAHYDFMLDLLGLARSAKSPNSFRLIPFVGLGYEYKFDSAVASLANSPSQKNTHSASAHAGLQLAVRLGSRVDLVCEGEGSWNGLQLAKSFPIRFENSLRFMLSAGLNFRLGKVGFTPVRPVDHEAIASLQGQINALRAENAELSKRPVDCPEVLSQPIVDTENRFLADKSILFRHGKSQVSDDQLITIFDAAQFSKDYDGELIVTGYVQKSETRFKDLAQKRAQAVAKVLTDKYGVPSYKITVEWKQAADAPFDTKSASWNRVVVIRSK
ncbi:MAG: OmpA family protein [Porphyromonadaceae bacterium]|nr:OmpA family protein [Porphyromonadaceae bacterium]